MQRKLGKILSLSLAGLLLCGVLSAGGAVLPAYAEEDYYAPITATKGEELLGQLHDLITTTHGHYTTYADCRDYGHTTDYAEGGKMSIIEFYTHETITNYVWSTNSPGTWNREHVWCKALSNGLWKDIKNNERGGGADLHHIRPSELKMNGDRGNDKFGEVTNGGEVYSKKTDGSNSQLGGHHAGGVFEPLDNVKGDAARIVLYLYVHYNKAENVHGMTNGNGQSSYFGTLKFTNVMAASSEEAAIELLLKWNELDPVDDIETTRNEEVFKIQGNRNPFIDHPEYADMIWNPPAEPEPVEPEPVEPEPEPKPEPTEPEPTEPEPTEPKPTEPEPSKTSDGGEKNHAALIGGIVGGVCGAAVIVAVIVFVVLRRKRK